jgi:hypothetical protein
MPTKKTVSSPDSLEPLIFTIRGHRVILDADLARVYDVPTYRLNEAIKRNRRRFPDDFAFQLTAAEFANLRSQIAISSSEPLDSHQGNPNSSQIAMSSSGTKRSKDRTSNWSQFVTSSSRHRGATYRPWAFTEHGALMAANVLRSERATQMSVYVVRAFVKMREHLAANAAILKRLAEIDKTLLEHDQSLQIIWNQLQPLLEPPPDPPKRRIGFHPKGRR